MKTGSKIKTEQTVSYRGFVIVLRIRHQALSCYRFISSVSQTPMTSAIPGYLRDRHNLAGSQEDAEVVLFRKDSVTSRFVRSHTTNDRLPVTRNVATNVAYSLELSNGIIVERLWTQTRVPTCQVTLISNKWHQTWRHNILIYFTDERTPCVPLTAIDSAGLKLFHAARV